MFQVDENAGTAVLRLARGKVNALDVELLEGLVDQLADLERSDAGAVVITGAGRAFSAGVDLFRVLEGGPAYVDRLMPALVRALEALFGFPKPVVAAVNGAAIAGGCVMACACDRRIAGPDALIGASELRVGVPFPAAALEILRYACGDHAEEVILSAGVFRGHDALTHRLVDEVVAARDVLDRATEVARDLATLSPFAYQRTKAQLRAPALQRIAARAGDEQDMRSLWASPATAAAIEASLQRTVGRSH
jgi:enoyl-CoA hydratase/carnithine racemase